MKSTQQPNPRTKSRPKSRPKKPRVMPASSISPSTLKPVGVLGGGQLARLLALKGYDLGVKTAIFSEHRDDPAAQVSPLWHRGRLTETAALQRFLKSCSIVTFESEFVDAERLQSLATETKTPIHPKPSTIGLIQDRLSQKQLLARHQLPTAQFHNVETPDEARWAHMTMGGAKIVFKRRRFGYDGYGTFVVNDGRGLERFIRAELAPGKNPYGFIAERFVPFQRELAVMVARSTHGQTVVLPFVESKQVDSRCLWVKGPVKPEPRFLNLAQTLVQKLVQMLHDLDYCGIMGVELFDDGSELLINELAPRVHNTGHYSLNALNMDQFTIHLKCILGLNLSQPKVLDGGFAMLNLLGSSTRPAKLTSPDDIALHWYGKSENRPGRKMGHITALANSPEAALSRLLRARRRFEV